MACRHMEPVVACRFRAGHSLFWGKLQTVEDEAFGVGRDGPVRRHEIVGDVSQGAMLHSS